MSEVRALRAPTEDVKQTDFPGGGEIQILLFLSMTNSLSYFSLRGNISCLRRYGDLHTSTAVRCFLCSTVFPVHINDPQKLGKKMSMYVMIV